MKSDCARAGEIIQLLVDGRISGTQRAWLDAHLLHCAGCARSAERYQRLSSLAAEWAGPTPADDPGDVFDSRLMSVLERESRAPRGRSVALPGLVAIAAVIVSVWIARDAGMFSAAIAAISPGDLARSAARLPEIGREIWTQSWISASGLFAGGSSLPAPEWAYGIGAAAIIANILFVLQALRSRKLAHI